MSALFSSLVERALRIASKAHRGQNRKQTEWPYISHPAAVALILVRAGFDDDAILAAAILHDVVEDTDYSAAQVAAEFPAPVPEYVAALTERKCDDAGYKRPWSDRKREHIEQVRVASTAARAITLADKLHNLGCTLIDLENGQPVWDRFNAPRDAVIDYHRRMIAAAESGTAESAAAALGPLAAECRAILIRLESSGSATA